MVRRAYAGQHQQLRRADGAGTQDDFALRVLLCAALALLNAECNRATLFENDVKNLHRRAYGEVGTFPNRMQKRVSGAATLSLELRNLVKAEPFLLVAIEVGIARMSALLGGFDKSFRKRIDGTQIGDVQRTCVAVKF